MAKKQQAATSRAERSSLAEAVASIRKDMPEAWIDNLDDVEGIPTGSLVIDRITGVGGIPRGRFTEIHGWESSGKTTLALSVAAQVQKAGGFAGYIDAENALDFSVLPKMGVDFSDTSKGVYLTPPTAEDCLQVIDRLIEANADLVVLDSIPAMVPRAVTENEIGDVEQIGLRARLLSQTLPRLAQKARHSRTAIILLNQFRNKIETGWLASRRGTQETTPGGNAVRFYCSVRLELGMVKKGLIKRKLVDEFGKEVERPVLNEHRVTAVKNKVGNPYREGSFYIRYDDELGVFGIDNIQTLFDMGVAFGFITTKGSWFLYEGEAGKVSAQGLDAFYKELFSRPEIINELITRAKL